MTTSRPRIVVLDDYERALERGADWSAIRTVADVVFHHAPLRGEALHRAIESADAIVLMRDRTPFGAAELAAAPQLRFLVYTGTRNAALDAGAVSARGVGIGNTEFGPSKASTTELTWALILAATQRLETQFALMRGGGWRADRPLAGYPSVLEGERLGVAGLGSIGARVARIGSAFGMEVVTWSPHMTPERAAQHGAIAVTLQTLLATSKVVTLHLVPSAETTRLIDGDRLASMRGDAILVNTSRARLVDMDALVAALARGRPAMAALDVYDSEPLPPGSPLRALPNVVLTPHMGYVSAPVLATFAKGVVDNLAAWLAGGPAVHALGA